MAVQWLHAAQAPVRPRHCTQALLQLNQINSYSLIPCRTAAPCVKQPPSPAIASPSDSALQHQSSATAASICRESLASWVMAPKCESISECVRESGKGSRYSSPCYVGGQTPYRHFFDHLMGVLGWLYPVVGHPAELYLYNRRR